MLYSIHRTTVGTLPRRSRSKPRSQARAPAVALTALLAVWASGSVHAQNDATEAEASSAAAARWGQASALVNGLFVVQGGKTQGVDGGYTYSSAPNIADMYVLDLSTSFNASSPPWHLVNVSSSGTDAPTVSFHTLSPLAKKRLLVFGGDGTPTVPIQTNNDSAYTAQLSGSGDSYSVQYSRVAPTWDEPMRRLYHTAESDLDGCIWMIGGEKGDGSGFYFDELYTLTSIAPGTEPSFSLSDSSPPGSIAGATSTLLSDGTLLLLLGGLDSTGQLQSMEQINTFNTKKGTWATTTTTLAAAGGSSGSAVPPARRGHVAVSLPDQRVFIQGGASADFSTVYSDAWLLDWSVDPPVWTELNSTGGPGARYGHAAVAYGRQVVTTFGWSGGNPTDDGVYVFDATGMTSSGSGTWSGGDWSSTYIPDPEVAASRAGQGTTSTGTSTDSFPSGSASSPSSNTASTSSTGSTSTSHGGNGSSTSDGGKDSGRSDNPDGSSTATTDNFPTSQAQPTDKASGSTSGGATAGAAVGALIGAGLIVVAGYAVYRQRSARNNWRQGDGAAGLLGRGGGAGGDYDDDFFKLEKTSVLYSNERPYDSDPYSGERAFLAAGGGATAAGAGAGKRTAADRRGADQSPWTAGNIGHAMEGSGPHFRERLAILTGRRQNAGAHQPRFDMLADEEDGQSYRGSRWARGAPLAHGDEDKDEDDAELEADAQDRAAWQGDHLQEQSYAAVGHMHAQDLSIGDIGGGGGHDTAYRGDYDYVTSPFEDTEGRGAAAYGTRLLAGAGVALVGKRAYKLLSNDGNHHAESGESGDDEETGPASDARHSAQSHTNTSARSGNSGTASSGQSRDPLSPGGFVSFSDAAPYGPNRGGLISPLGSRTSPSPMMKRSPTWWDRFMSNSFLERSASGRLLSGPGAEAPIRDPTQPPELAMIAESPATHYPGDGNHDDDDDENPFRDAAVGAEQQHLKRVWTCAAGLDEMGCHVTPDEDGTSPFSSYQHGRSLSSLNSNRTATSSMLEYQLRNMQVIQRVRTGSSRRSGSTRTGSTSDTESMGALSRGPSMLRPRNLGPLEESESTPESVVWQPHNWATQQPMYEGEEEEEDENDLTGGSLSPRIPPSPFTGDEEAAVHDTSIASPAEAKASLRSSPSKALRHAQAASETPSITPATTKRAHLNPLLTSPLRPEPVKSSPTVLSGSVRDRVKAIEQHDLGATLLPTSPSSKAWSASLGTASLCSYVGDSSVTSCTANTAATTPASEKVGPILTFESVSPPDAAAGKGRKTSPTPHRTKSGRAPEGGEKLSYSHGLVPKPQLFVANPDDRRSGSGAS